ncbi:MAG: hypothetical protein OXI20_10420 [Rhodospirillales bacterium]|nr:hypothetical protein [Rhodospirillales bacterium]
MTPAQKALREARAAKSTNRQRMAEIGLMADADVTDEIRSEQTELEGAVPELERRERAAQAAVDLEEDRQREEAAAGAKDGLDPETRERLELRGKVKLTRYLEAGLEGRAVDGVEAEYMGAIKQPLVGRHMGGTAIPLELLAPVEERATTDTDTTTTPRRWLDRLFADTAAMRLGVTMESVPTGVASYPVTTAGASAAQLQRGTDDAADAAWTIGVTEAKPKRNAVRAVFTIEDAARIPGLESALTRDLRMALTEGIDRAIFIGDTTASGTDSDITGLQTAAITETTITQGNKVKGPETLTAFTGMVDGIHAASLADLNVVAAVGAWRLWETTIINSGADNMTLAAFMREAGLSWSSRGNIEDATANGDFGAFVGRRRGIDGAGVAAVWEAGELIRDPYTAAAGGEVALTLCYLWDFQIPRTSNFRRIKFVT